MEKITREMKIDEVLKKYPKTEEIFAKNDFHCVGCAAASFESIAQGAVAHGIDVEKLVEDLNNAIEK